MDEIANTFGGLWTRKKIEILKEYLAIYSKALKNITYFDLYYADAFAGTGSHIQKLISNQESFLPLVSMEGSVRAALGVEPGFKYYHFNDLNPDHVRALKRICAENPGKRSSVHQQDGNEFVRDFCSNLRKQDRAVLFIDPFNTEFEWETFKAVSVTKKVDMWLLFPISVILRMTPKNGQQIRPEWREKINKMLGTTDWEDALYLPKDLPPMDDLFDQPKDVDPLTERINPDELSNWVHGRLEEIFEYVAKPVLLTNKNRPLFLLFFAVSNPDKKARELAQRLSKAAMKKA